MLQKKKRIDRPICLCGEHAITICPVACFTTGSFLRPSVSCRPETSETFRNHLQGLQRYRFLRYSIAIIIRSPCVLCHPLTELRVRDEEDDGNYRN